MAETLASTNQRVVFFHPDLGIGGAERLVIDAAVGLQTLGYTVIIYTSHCDPSHCFEEARNGTLDVRVRGNWLFPQTIFGRFWILCAILRQMHLITEIAVLSNELRNLLPSFFFVDQLSAGIPLLRFLFSQTRILFYCHFPDKYLAKQDGLLKHLYRLPFDWLESWSTGCSDGIVVNSQFTRGVFAQAFPLLRHKWPRVVYPCVGPGSPPSKDSIPLEGPLWHDDRILLSINRFERKKDVGLALRAFAKVRPDNRKNSKLVIAGGFDHRIEENVSYLKDLEALTASLDLKYITVRNVVSASVAAKDVQVVFFLSVPTVVKEKLLSSAKILIYTPRNEHLGIVPLEAMRAGLPVLAANEGGPTETVVEGQTGWLRDVAQEEEWATILQRVLGGELDDASLRRMGEKGKQRVKDNFSRERMAQRLDEELSALKKASRSSLLGNYGKSGLFIMVLLGVVLAFGLQRFM